MVDSKLLSTVNLSLDRYCYTYGETKGILSLLLVLLVIGPLQKKPLCIITEICAHFWVVTLSLLLDCWLGNLRKNYFTQLFVFLWILKNVVLNLGMCGPLQCTKVPMDYIFHMFLLTIVRRKNSEWKTHQKLLERMALFLQKHQWNKSQFILQ